MNQEEAVLLVADAMTELVNHIDNSQTSRLILGYAKTLRLICSLSIEEQKEETLESQGSSTRHD